MGKNSNRGVMFLFTLLLFGSLIFWPTSTASAEELYVEELETFTEDLELDTSDLPDNEELFAGYVDKMFYGTEISTFGSAGRERLTDVQKLVYDYFKEQLENIASGESNSSDIHIPIDVLNKWDDAIYSAEKLGYPNGFTNENINEAAQKYYDLMIQEINFPHILRALLYDCPYEMYWVDKTAGVSSNIDIDLTDNQKALTLTDVYMKYSVIPAYKLTNAINPDYCVDISKTILTSTAVTNANKIVKDNNELDDYEKLLAYCNVICNLTDYNHEAVQPEYTDGYGDPWQLIWVFDGDDSTKVVCEGYAKAFQYLCDMSQFSNDKVRSYLISGDTGGGHMWNIVTMEDGNNYLVDLTNTDNGWDFFLAGAPEAGNNENISTGYTFYTNEQYVKFVYDEWMFKLYGNDASSILNIARTSYDDVTTPTPAPLTFASVSLGLSDNLSLKFKTELPNGYSEPYVVFSFDTDNDDVTANEEVTVDGTLENGKYVFEFSDIAPDQITEIITATLYAKYDEALHSSEPLTYSVAEYCYTTLANSSSASKETLRKLLVDLLNYGAAAQEYTGTNVDNLANAELTTTQEAWGTQAVPELTKNATITNNMGGEKANWISAKLILKDSITIRFKFEASDIENLKVKVNGSNIASKNIVSAGEENKYYAIYEGIMANQMRKDLSVVVYDGENAVSETLTYSVEAYATHMSSAGEGEAFKNLVFAMMKYGDSAKAYAGQ